MTKAHHLASRTKFILTCISISSYMSLFQKRLENWSSSISNLQIRKVFRYFSARFILIWTVLQDAQRRRDHEQCRPSAIWWGDSRLPPSCTYCQKEWWARGRRAYQEREREGLDRAWVCHTHTACRNYQGQRSVQKAAFIHACVHWIPQSRASVHTEASPHWFSTTASSHGSSKFPSKASGFWFVFASSQFFAHYKREGQVSAGSVTLGQAPPWHSAKQVCNIFQPMGHALRHDPSSSRQWYMPGCNQFCTHGSRQRRSCGDFLGREFHEG